MTVGDVAIGVAIGLVAGVLSGLFGVGGGIVMTPGIQVLLGAPPIVALATPVARDLPDRARGGARLPPSRRDRRAGGRMDRRARHRGRRGGRVADGLRSTRGCCWS